MLSRKQITYWLLASAAVIMMLLLLLPLILDSETLKAKLQATIEHQTGGQVQYQQAELSFLPRPFITLRQIKIDLPEQAQGTVATLQVYPQMWSLLTGQVRLDRLVLESPEISLILPEVGTEAGHQASALSFTSLQESLDRVLTPFAKAVPDLTLIIKNGFLTLSKGQKTLNSAKGLNLKLNLNIAESNSFNIVLKASTSALTFQHQGQEIMIEGLDLRGQVHKEQTKLSLVLDDLSLTKPALKLNGLLAVGSTSPAFALDLRGTDIDVDATRETALTLAGDTTPVQEIFDYLRGGTVPRISFHSRGETVSELGELKNIVIKGQLQTGSVSVPELKLDLTEVNGEVAISDGVLQGTELSTLLEGSSGHDGTLKVGLTEGNDLFQLELMLSADLAQAQKIVKRIVDTPIFDREVDKITNLSGTSIGKLVLGDSLRNIHARVEASDLKLSADYQGLPFPLQVTQGQVAFTEHQVILKNLQGSMGKSDFSGLACNFNWENTLHMEISSGQFGLDLDQLYPWLAALEQTKATFQEIKQATGRLNLTALSLKGNVDKPEEWAIATAGEISDISMTTPRFPGKTTLAHGTFNFDTAELAVQNLKVNSLDAELSLSATLAGLPQSLDSVELAVEGTLGKDSVAWLQKTLEVPGAYTLRTPIALSEAKVVWHPDAATSFKGKVDFVKGPNLSLAVSHRPEQLSVNRLKIKDQHSDVEVVFKAKDIERNLNFNGTLQHETLEAMFIDQPFGKGRLHGDIGVKMSQGPKAVPTAQGQLNGENLMFPLASGESIELERISLLAEGSQVKAEAKALSWHDFVWDPVKATINFGRDKIDINIAEAEMCGIDSSGFVSIVGADLALNLTLQGKDLDVASSYSCLTEGRVKMTGALDFSTRIRSQGQAKELIKNLQGPLEMTFRKGSIEQSKLLARTLEVLNVTEIVKGKLPNLGSAGFAYSTITIQGDFQGDTLVMNEILMDGETLDVLGQGKIDFGQETIDAELLAAPFKTIDTVVKHIPGVNYLLAGSLVTIPVSIKGDQRDPKVSIMSPSSVGSSLMSLGGRIIKSPIKLIETMTPAKSEGKD